MTHIPPALILCDFDGTIASKDILDTLAARFGTRRVARNPYTAFNARSISHGELTQGIAEMLDVSETDFNAFVGAIPLRHGFDSFVARVRAANIPLAVLSSGWDAYILHMIAHHAPVLMQDMPTSLPRTDVLPVYSNRLTYRGNNAWHQETVWPNTDQNSYPDKASVIRAFRAYTDGPIWMIGDGISDLSAAGAADRVFARAALARYLHDAGQAFTAFESFDTIEVL